MDYKKVLKMMQAIDWQYQGEPVTLDDLESTAQYVEYQAMLNKKTVSCGGFMYIYSERTLYFVGAKANEA